MKAILRRHSGVFCILVLVLLCVPSMAMAKTKKETVKFDFKKTSEYFHELLDKRPDFPVSVVLLNDYVYSLAALGETVDPKLKERMITFTKKIQQLDGGFSVDIATKESSSLYTNFALETLALIGSVGSIDAGAAKSYIASLKQKDGGFSFNTKKNESTLPTTYHAVHSLFILNGLSIVDKAKTAEYIKGFEKKETGGFSYVRGTGVATAKDTFMAVEALRTLGMLDNDTKTRALKFLTSLPYIGKFKKTSETLTLEEQVYTLSALRVLEDTAGLDKQKITLFLKKFYVPEDGAFAAIEGFKTAPDPTCLGVRGLVELGVLKRPVESQLK